MEWIFYPKGNFLATFHRQKYSSTCQKQRFVQLLSNFGGVNVNRQFNGNTALVSSTILPYNIILWIRAGPQREKERKSSSITSTDWLILDECNKIKAPSVPNLISILKSVPWTGQ